MGRLSEQSFLCINVDSIPEKYLHDFCMIQKRCRLEEISIVATGRVDVGTLIDQKFYDPCIANRRCCYYGTAAPEFFRTIDLYPGLNKKPNDGLSARCRSSPKKRSV